jgi:hypothetical protein
MLSSFKGCVILFGSLHVAKSHKRSSMEGRCSDLVQDAPANYFISGEGCSVACMWSKKSYGSPRKERVRGFASGDILYALSFQGLSIPHWLLLCGRSGWEVNPGLVRAGRCIRG